MILIRTDANETIATGHVMRCLSIAKALVKLGNTVKFVVADHHPEQLIIENGFEVICLNSVWDNLEVELERLVEVIKSEKVSMLLIDTYYVTEFYLEQLREYAKVAYIDDIASFVYPVDLLINYNMYATECGYEPQYQAKGLKTQFALGSSYAPLRDEFLNVYKQINNEVSKIMITSGGTDNYNVSGNLLDRLAKEPWFSNMDYYVIVGKFNTNREILLEKWAEYKNVHFLTAINNVSDYMKLCDIAITAGGVTTYELCACGIPSIMYTMADNQLEIARSVSERQLITWVGDIRDNMQRCMDKIVENIRTLKDDVQKRKKLSIKMQDCVDGQGADRIAEAIIRIS